jgi:phospholipase C
MGGSSRNSVSPPSGWIAAFTSTQNSGAGQIFAFTKSAVSGDTSGSYTFTLTVGSGNTEFGFVGIVAAVGGAKGAAVDAAGFQNNAASTSVTSPSISPIGGSSDYLIAVGGVDNNVTFTAPTAMTREAALSVSAGSIAYADQVLSASGATGSRTFTISAAHGNSGALIALLPTGATPTPAATRSPTRTPAATRSPTRTPAATRSPTRTPAATRSPTRTPAATPSRTRTPVAFQHVIVIIGENHSFDNLFGAYVPPSGQTISNLLSKGIITASGGAGLKFSQAAQQQATDTRTYSIQPSQTGPYSTLPQPNTTYASGEPQYVPDPRFPANLPNGPFQITRYASYDNLFVGDPVHRFFQMWQQMDEGKMDLFVWSAQTAGLGPQSDPTPIPGNTSQGALSMGYYNMSAGDAPHFMSMADNYAISDNYHQAIIGGSDPAIFWILHDDVQYANSGCQPTLPPSNEIEIPDAKSGTNNFYTQDGPLGGSFVNCSDTTQPGVATIMNFLNSLPYKPFNGGDCAPNTYYLVNNTPPSGTPTYCANSLFQALQDIGVSVTLYGDELGEGINADQILTDISNNNLPAVSFVGPEPDDSGHPAYSTLSAFETLSMQVANAVIRNSSYVHNTAIFITMDESGGYYDSGYVQPIDFFGDGPRIPLIAISAYTKQGYVDHTYYDHSSISKFIEKNWGLSPLSSRTRDNLPNPIPSSNNPYIPSNAPAIGDLMNLFDFSQLRSNPPAIQ